MLKNISKNKIALAILIVVVIVFSIGIRVVLWDKASANLGDLLMHFYEMRAHYENGTFPVVGAGFLGLGSFNNTTTPRVPGSAFYLYYMICYSIGGGNLDNAIAVNFVFTLLAAFIFLFWVYKRFGMLVFAVISALVLTNGYLIYVNYIIYNPNIALFLSLVFLPILAEYISKERNFIASILIFPLLAIMAQGHFSVFNGLIPSVIVYMVIRYKHTIKNIVGLSISVFLAFLTYLPYLISEINSNFHNLNNVISRASRHKGDLIIIPRLQALLIFPTNEMSDNYRVDFLDMWTFNSPLQIILFVVFVIVFITIVSITIFVIIKFFRNREFVYNTYRELDNNAFVLKELMLIYLLYFPVCIAATTILNGVSGPFRHHYSVFSLSFVPWLIFLNLIVKNQKDKLIFYTLIFATIATIYFSAMHYNFFKKFYEPNSWKSHRDTVASIASDAKGQEFSLTEGSFIYENLDKSGQAYNKNGMWNLVQDTNSAAIIYNIEYKGQNKLDSNIYTNATLIESNNIFVVHRIK